MLHAVLNSQRAWEEFERWLELPEVVFLLEPEGLHGRFKVFAEQLDLGQASWTDAYLAAFAVAGGYRVVTFDGGFGRYAGLDLLRLHL